ncbi:hypothetical protein OJAV_G00082390 [Oryzias javanicus]|uniref:Uncharacterized protein n=1 Tax=Oryzias javanicus TaxID=123683 RepID=A0A3S2UFM9_ORYJA|nr:hypothetical protein OJAV_G00082390 [Oryzias javanicus]
MNARFADRVMRVRGNVLLVTRRTSIFNNIRSWNGSILWSRVSARRSQHPSTVCRWIGFKPVLLRWNANERGSGFIMSADRSPLWERICETPTFRGCRAG